MKTGWLLPACTALTVGVGLMSCMKEQIDQIWSSIRAVNATEKDFATSELKGGNR